MGKCIDCGSALIQTVTRGAVEKYLSIATNMSKQYKINDYLRSRIESIALELKLIFKEEKAGPVEPDGVYEWLRILYKCLVDLDCVFLVLCTNDRRSAA